jgi:hypothetical protein
MPEGLLADVLHMVSDVGSGRPTNDLMFFSIPLFVNAPDRLLQKIRRYLTPLAVILGSLIIELGAKGDSMFFLRKGHAELNATDGHTIRGYKPGE